MLYTWDKSAVSLYLGNFEIHPDIAERFIHSLTELSDGFKYLERLLEGKQNELFSIEETLVDPKIMDTFQKAVLEFQNKVRNTPPWHSILLNRLK